MTSPSFQSVQASAQAPGYLRFHPKPYGNIRFCNAVAVLTDRREAHADNAVLFGNLGNNIDPMRVCSVIEDDQDFVAIADFPDCTDHSHPFSIVRNV